MQQSNSPHHCKMANHNTWLALSLQLYGVGTIADNTNTRQQQIIFVYFQMRFWTYRWWWVWLAQWHRDRILLPHLPPNQMVRWYLPNINSYHLDNGSVTYSSVELHIHLDTSSIRFRQVLERDDITGGIFNHSWLITGYTGTLSLTLLTTLISSLFIRWKSPPRNSLSRLVLYTGICLRRSMTVMAWICTPRAHIHTNKVSWYTVDILCTRCRHYMEKRMLCVSRVVLGIVTTMNKHDNGAVLEHPSSYDHIYAYPGCARQTDEVRLVFMNLLNIRVRYNNMYHSH